MGCGMTKKKNARKESIRTVMSERPPRVSINSFFRNSTGEMKGKYRMIKELGRGSFSTVFLSTQILTGRVSALKIIQKSDISTEQVSGSLKIKEAEILTTLDHPNIIKCYEVLEETHQIILSEEYIKGHTLLEYRTIKNKFLSESDMIPIMTQLLSALAYIHERGVVHRDIKLDNVFITEEDSTVKLGDFGCAAYKSDQNPISGIFGTLMYMAPEIFKEQYNEKVDIWSTGVVLFILITGKPPYRVKSEEDLQNAVKNNQINLSESILSNYSKDFTDFLRGLLHSNPEERFSAKEALQHTWLQTSKPTSKIPKSILEKLKNFPKQTLLKKILSLYICSFLLEDHKICEFSNYFKNIDKNGDGVIDKCELVEVFLMEWDKKESELSADEFLKSFDLNCNGVIDFMEFVAAVCEEENVINDKNLEKVFKEVAKGKEFVTLGEIGKWAGVGCGGLMLGLKKVYKKDDRIKIGEFKDLLN